jgi:predicted RNA-binding protein with PUA-like domain
MAVNYWLMKSEPDEFSITDLKNKPNQTEHWDGVRNYQAPHKPLEYKGRE